MNQDDLDRYFAKSGDDKIYPVNLVQNSYGFCSFRIEDDILFIINTYGNGEYWDAYLTAIAKQNSCTKIRFATRRNPKTFSRKYGAKLVGYVLEREVL
jgi:hypothetical protein